MARPTSRSKHGTAEHGSETDVVGNQVVTQRNAFSGGETDNFITGAFRGGVRSFNIADRGTSAAIMRAAENMMQYRSANNVGSGASSGDSMDFPAGQGAANMLFQGGNNKFSEVENAVDNPNIFGPNTKVAAGLLDNPGATGETQTTPATQSASVDATAEASYDSKGFGVSIDRNDPRRNPHGLRNTLTHVKRESQESTKLGEYIDSATYEYDES